MQGNGQVAICLILRADSDNHLVFGFVREDGEVMAKSAMDAGLRHVLTLEEGEWAFSEWEK